MTAPAPAQRSMRTRRTWSIALLALALQGCMKVTVVEYGPLTRPLDGKNELHISTYAAWFPRQTKSVPFLYKALHTSDSVFFQVFIREAGTRGGKNPNIESIRIHSFSYGFPGQDSIVALTDYSDNFWQQGDPKNDARTRKAVLHSEGWYLRLKLHLTLNGQEHRIDEVVHANTRTSYRPLFLEAFR